MPGHYHLRGTEVKKPRTFIAKPPPKRAPTEKEAREKLKGTEVKKPYSFISQPIPQDPIPVRGSGGTMPNPLFPHKKKKKDETPTEMQFTSASPEKLKIRKKKGKRGFRYKGSVGMNQNRGLSGISVGGI